MYNTLLNLLSYLDLYFYFFIHILLNILINDLPKLTSPKMSLNIKIFFFIEQFDIEFRFSFPFARHIVIKINLRLRAFSCSTVVITQYLIVWLTENSLANFTDFLTLCRKQQNVFYIYLYLHVDRAGKRNRTIHETISIINYNKWAVVWWTRIIIFYEFHRKNLISVRIGRSVQ